MSFYADEFFVFPSAGDGVAFQAGVPTYDVGRATASGDFNGDGLTDLAIAAGTTTAGYAGTVYVVFGDGAPPQANLQNLDVLVANGDAAKIDGAGSITALGFQGAMAAGDIDGDGLDDLLIGAAPSGTGAAGAAVVVFGDAMAAGATVTTTDLDGADGFRIGGSSNNDYMGLVVDVGDFTGDGFDDILVGAPCADIDDVNTGAVYLIHGKSGAFSADVDANALLGADGTLIFGGLGDAFGRGVANIGDIDNDGVEDFAVGSSNRDLVRVFHGLQPAITGQTSFGASHDIPVTFAGPIMDIFGNGLDAGERIAGIGDFNGDGFDDFIVDSRLATAASSAGEAGAHIILGAPRTAANQALNQASARRHLIEIDSFGIYDFAGVGDINGDGFDDVAIVVDRFNVAFVFGRADFANTPPNIAALDGADGFRAQVSVGADARGLSAVDDFDGDGRPDFLLHTAGSATSVIFGRPDDLGALNLVGSRGGQTILGGEDDDVISGRRGDDVLRGFEGDDILDGEAGEDILNGDAGDDTLNGGANADTANGGDGDDVIRGEGGDDILRGGDDNDDIDGGSGDDQLFGDDGDDVLVGQNGDDRHTGGMGRDQIDAGSGDDWAVGGLGVDVINGGSGDDVLGGGSQDDILIGGSGGDLLNGGPGADHMTGGDGNDRYTVDNAGDVVNEEADAGIDLIQTALSTFSLETHVNIEDLTVIGAGANAAFTGTGNDLDNNITGGDANDVLTGGRGADALFGLGGADALNGGEGDDILDGGEGVDTMTGGDGDDIYIVDALADVIVEAANGGVDEAQIAAAPTTTGNFNLADNVENAVLLSGAVSVVGNDAANSIAATAGAGQHSLFGGGGADQLFGSVNTDLLVGGEGDDTLTAGDFGVSLVGGSGADTMIGGGDLDVFFVDNVGDAVSDQTLFDSDLVRADVSFTLPDFVERLTLVLGQANALNGTGNGLANTIAGNEFDNRLDGGQGADFLQGLAGDDVYVVDNVGDVVSEINNLNNGGVDTVEASVSFTLDAFVENLILTNDVAATDGVGNVLDNQITGSDAANVLTGDDGEDVLVGRLGVDILFGGAGDDELDAGAEAGDLMEGGLGDDLYFVRNSAQTVTELLNQGTDAVRAFVDFALQDNIEDLTLDDAAAILPITGSGNALANTINGNSADNQLFGLDGDDNLLGGDGDDTLDGGLGADALTGGAGDDVYVIDDAGDDIREFNGAVGGTDQATVLFSAGFSQFDMKTNTLGGIFTQGLEDATVLFGDGEVLGNVLDNKIVMGLTGGALVAAGGDGDDSLGGGLFNDRLIGGAGDDVIGGDNGTDRIFGNAGDDVIGGGEGDDVMTGQSGLDRFEIFASSGADIVTDFVIGQDTVAIHSSTGFTSFAQVQAVLSGSVDATIAFSAVDVLKLNGVDSALLNSTDFVFFG